jgi:pimeloyl-ACP methyl ester carboxylesterase
VTAVVLIHSPLTGPTVWHPVANVLTRFGSVVRVPELDPRAHPTWEALAQSVVDQLAGKLPNEGTLIMAHSASGALLPLLKDRMARIQGLVYVDAVMPGDEGSLLALRSPDEREALLASAVDGLIPPWGEGFSDELWQTLVPQPELRDRFRAELKPTPLSLFHAPLAATPASMGIPGAYLQLSPFYAREAAQAKDRGWPVEQIDAHHLQMLADPVVVTYAILRLASNF